MLRLLKNLSTRALMEASQIPPENLGFVSVRFKSKQEKKQNTCCVQPPKGGSGKGSSKDDKQAGDMCSSGSKGGKKPGEMCSSQGGKKPGDMSSSSSSKGGKKAGEMCSSPGGKKAGEMCSSGKGGKKPGEMCSSPGGKKPGDMCSSSSSKGGKKAGEMCSSPGEKKAGEMCSSPGVKKGESKGGKKAGEMCSSSSKGGKKGGEMCSSPGGKKGGDQCRSKGGERSGDMCSSTEGKQAGEMCSGSGKGGKEAEDMCYSKDDDQHKDDENGSHGPRIAINGFGRIGRMVMRVATEHSCPLEIVAINDGQMAPDYMAYMLKNDSTHGRFLGDIEVDGHQLVIDGKAVCTYKETDPKKIPWNDLEVDYVVEATGKLTSVKDAEAHIKSGAKNVVITAPSKDAPMYVVGINLDSYDPSQKVVSAASCTTNALAPLAKVIHENFGMLEGLVTSVHSVTPSQKVVDMPAKNWRSGRGGMQNIIPATTGAATAVTKVYPELEGKLNAIAMRVPTPNVSLIDLTCRLKEETTLDKIRSALNEAKEGSLIGILDVANEEAVSTDFKGSHYSCIYDSKGSLALNKNLFKLLAWYDNEYGYTCRVIDLIKFMFAEQQSACA